MSADRQNSKRRGRLTLVALAILFIGPLAIAWTVYMTGVWRPGAGVNHGELIQPVVTLPRNALPDASGGSTDGGFLYGKWSLVHWSPGVCDENCAAAVLKTRQIRFAMLREADRVQRVLFYSELAPKFADDTQPDLIIAQLAGEPGSSIRNALEANGGKQRIFLIDPIGNLILSYPLDGNPADIRDDLKRLMRISRIG